MIKDNAKTTIDTAVSDFIDKNINYSCFVNSASHKNDGNLAVVLECKGVNDTIGVHFIRYLTKQYNQNTNTTEYLVYSFECILIEHIKSVQVLVNGFPNLNLNLKEKKIRKSSYEAHEILSGENLRSNSNYLPTSKTVHEVKVLIYSDNFVSDSQYQELLLYYNKQGYEVYGGLGEFNDYEFKNVISGINLINEILSKIKERNRLTKISQNS